MSDVIKLYKLGHLKRFLAGRAYLRLLDAISPLKKFRGVAGYQEHQFPVKKVPRQLST